MKTPEDAMGFNFENPERKLLKPDYYVSNGKDLFDRYEAGLMSYTEVVGFYKGNVIKYLTRYRNKNGIEDLKKAETYLDRLIEFERKLSHDTV